MNDRVFHALKVVEKCASGNAGLLISLHVPIELQQLYEGLPGQHVVVRARIDGAEVRRTYSVISPAGGSVLQIAVRTQPAGAMSGYLSNELEQDDTLDVMPPTGSFHSRLDGPGQRHYLMVAAGSGITPVLALLRAKLSQEALSTCTLLSGNRDTARMLCMDEVLALKDRFLERLSLHFFMTREPQAQSRFNGRIDPAKLADFLAVNPGSREFDECFVCMPGVMDGRLRSVLQAGGIPPDRIHCESFTTATPGETPLVRAAGDVSSSPDAEPEELVSVTVIMGGRRRSFTTSASESLLSAGLVAGLDLPYSCCGGVCSTCRSRVVEGAVEMAQNYALEDWELKAGYVLVCQSKPITPVLVLDYDAV